MSQEHVMSPLQRTKHQSVNAVLHNWIVGLWSRKKANFNIYIWKYPLIYMLAT